MLILFIALQLILLLYIVLHDWISVPPFNDIQALKQADGNYRIINSIINGIPVFIPLVLTITSYSHRSLSIMTNIIIFYFILTVGTLLSWWVPYLFGSSQQYKHRFSKFKNTHHFLPARADNVIPNTLHVILHLQVWACLGISIYFYMNC